MGPGLHPQYTRAQFAGEAVGGLTNSTSPMTHKQNKRMPETLVSAQYVFIFFGRDHRPGETSFELVSQVPKSKRTELRKQRFNVVA